jgi:hypothetical protein
VLFAVRTGGQAMLHVNVAWVVPLNVIVAHEDRIQGGFEHVWTRTGSAANVEKWYIELPKSST